MKPPYRRRLSETLEAKRANLVGVDRSESMASRYEGFGRVEAADALAYEFDRFDVAVIFLTLMFFPVASRGDFAGYVVARGEDL